MSPGVAPPWRPGQSGNPKGRPIGSGSIVKFIKDRLGGAPLVDDEDYETLADELAVAMIEKARGGNRNDYRFMQEILNRSESRTITEEQLSEEIERVHEVVAKHILRIEEGPSIMARIAREIAQLEKESRDD